GRGVRVSGGGGLGGVVEPPAARPFIVEGGAFLGGRAIVVEGVVVEEEAVLAANTVLTASTRIIDVTGPEPREWKGRVPPRSVVIPGSGPKQFPAGTYNVPCALVIGQRSASTDKKTSLNQALRDFGVPVSPQAPSRGAGSRAGGPVAGEGLAGGCPSACGGGRSASTGLAGAGPVDREWDRPTFYGTSISGNC